MRPLTSRILFASLLGAGALALAARVSGDDPPHHHGSPPQSPPSGPAADYRPVVTPNGTTLPWKLAE